MNPGGPDSSFAGHELYRALRGSQGDDPLTDELLWDGDFLTSQREFMQKKQEEQLLERLERRMGEQQRRSAAVMQHSVMQRSSSSGWWRHAKW
jgi:hypothetical protein